MAQAENLSNKFGKMAGWNSVTINLFGRDVEGILDISYDDNVEHEKIMGAGNMPIGYGEGNYEANVSLTLHMEEVQEILRNIPPGMRISDAAPVPVVVQYVYQDRIVTDVLNHFKITGLGKEVRQGDKVVGQTITCFCISINWNVT